MLEKKHMIDHKSYHVSVGKVSYMILEFPPKNSRNFLVMQSGVGDTGRHTYLKQLTNPTLQLYPSGNT